MEGCGPDLLAACEGLAQRNRATGRVAECFSSPGFSANLCDSALSLGWLWLRLCRSAQTWPIRQKPGLHSGAGSLFSSVPVPETGRQQLRLPRYGNSKSEERRVGKE